MKKLLLLLILFYFIALSNAQDYQIINFDDGYFLDQLFIDTLANPNNIWEIGIPNKSIFNSSFSPPNSICTDLNNNYPVRDTSSFLIKHLVGSGYYYYGSCIFAGRYKIHTDSLSDFGTIEYSPDNGTTWIDLLTDTIYKNQGIYGWIKEANLTGSSNGWEWFELYAGGVDEFDINYIDTVMFKFTFISDSIENNKEGWILDDIYIDDFGDSSIDDFKWNNFNSFIFPNPSSDFISIKYENSIKSKYKVLIYDNLGRLIHKDLDQTGDFHMNIRDFNNGLYFYKIIDSTDSKYSFGKFIKQ